MSVVCHQVEVSATDRSLVQRSLTDCGVSNFVWSGNFKIEEAVVRVGLYHQRKQHLVDFKDAVSASVRYNAERLDDPEE
jgi:hypothetical protein